MQYQFYPANERGTKDLGWLQSKFSFSFSSYQHPTKKSFGLLHTFNDDLVKPGGGFGLHAHVNMEIISVMLAGTMNHKDSMGYSEVVEKDWVQIMSAGAGLRHEEHNVGNEDVRFLQIWIEPKLQNITPRYQKRYFPAANRQNAFKTIVSNEEGVEHCWINQNAKISLASFKTGEPAVYTFNPLNKCVFLFILEGNVSIHGKSVGKRDAMGIWDTSEINIAIEQDASFVVIEVPVNH